MPLPHARRLGHAAVVFDPATWQTHVLPPDAAVIVDIVADLSGAGPVSTAKIADYMRRELELDPEAEAIRELLQRLVEIGLLQA